MEKYRQERERQARRARVSGGILTVAIHVGLVVCFFATGFTYLDPPPPEKTPILIDFSEPKIEKPKQIWNGSRPQVENPDPTQPINLVQKSEAQREGTKANEAPEATVDDFGDVETPEPPREKPIDRRALFHAADNNTVKDTLAPQTAREASDELKAGHASGNTTVGKTDGEPNAKIEGRRVDGVLLKPDYGVQAEGTVVVKIWVNQYGEVTKAQAGVEGTSVTDKTLWQAAYKAAMGAHFNMDASAPALQEGTITYIFRMR